MATNLSLNQRKAPFRYTLWDTVVDAGTGQRNRAVAVSGTNTYYSNRFAVQSGLYFGFTHEWTGTPTGTLTFWYSDLDQPDETSDSDWKQDTTYTPVNPAGAAGSTGDNGTGTGHLWYRFKYVNASGSGVLGGDVNVPHLNG